MPAIELILGIVLAVLSLGLVVAVLMQPGKDKRLSGAIAGGSDTYMGKGKSSTMDQKLAKATKWIALAWIVLTLLLCLI